MLKWTRAEGWRQLRNNVTFPFLALQTLGKLADLISNPLGYIRTSKTTMEEESLERLMRESRGEGFLATKLQISALFSTKFY